MHTAFDIDLVRPGDGEEFVYSPVGVNATLHCAVNNTDLEWEIDGFNFESLFDRNHLQSRNIFQESTTTLLGITRSSVKVFGNVNTNNGTMICCRRDALREFCTTLIIYGIMIPLLIMIISMISIIDRPSRPKNVSVQYDGTMHSLNISWTMTFVMGVEQNYTIVFDTYVINTSQLYCVHYLGTLQTTVVTF